MTTAACPSGSPCAYAGRAGVGAVTLLSGVTCCSWCAAWRQECLDRANEAYAVLRLPDRETRRARLDTYEANARDDAIRRRAELAPLSPDEFAAESRRRVEAAIMALWHARRAAAMAPEA